MALENDHKLSDYGIENGDALYLFNMFNVNMSETMLMSECQCDDYHCQKCAKLKIPNTDTRRAYGECKVDPQSIQLSEEKNNENDQNCDVFDGTEDAKDYK